MNSMHIFLPPFERMIVHVIRKLLPRLTDPHLREQARGFLGQEAHHARAHALFLQNLRAQGYRIDDLVRFGAWLFNDVFERRLRPELCLSIIAGFEHYTDLLVLLVLQGDFLDGCDPRMKELFTWHAAEEVEHNAVAWEMLRALDDSYPLRMAGNVLGLSVLLGFLLAGTTLLLHQDRKLTDPDVARELREVFFTRYRLARDIKGLFLHYARRDYRPDDTDHGPLARPVLEST